MTIDTSKYRLPGFEHDSRGTIRITYHFPHGIQDVRLTKKKMNTKWCSLFFYI